MKTSRSLLSGYSKPFGFFILFTMGTLVGTTMTSETPVSTVHPDSPTPAPRIATAEQKEDVNTTSSPGIHSDVSLASSAEIEPPPSESISNTSGSNDITVEAKLSSEEAHTVNVSSVSYSKEQVPLVNSTTEPPPSESESTSVAQGTLGDISDTSPSSGQGIPHTHTQTTVGQKYSATPSKKKTPSETTPTISTIVSVTSGPEPSKKPRQTEAETEMTTVPGQKISNIITTSVTLHHAVNVSSVRNPEEKVPLVNSTTEPPSSEPKNTSVGQGTVGDISVSSGQVIPHTHTQKYPKIPSKKKTPSETATISISPLVRSGTEPVAKPEQTEKAPELITTRAQNILTNITVSAARYNSSTEAAKAAAVSLWRNHLLITLAVVLSILL